ncbi:MAG: acetate--CoA ligase family protein [Rhizobiales bacterium]|nr:acetate--CoA ligase family protein [Hyphomicrobiales bacterium]
MHALSHLFEPRGIAIVGASADLTRIGGQPVRALNRFGFRGAVYPVNPKYREIDGLRCYASVADIGAPCDVALIAVPAQAASEAVRACGAAGIPFCIVLSAGYRETGADGAALEAQLRQAAAKTGTRLIGPNCQGLLNLTTRLYAGFGSVFQEPELLAGSVSMVSQSGGFGFSVLMSCGARGIGFRVAISTGNEADVTTPEVIEALIEDPGTRIICAYIESVADGRRLMAAGRRALAAGKPLLVWKSGNSADGARAASSHTGSMTGRYDIYRAAFRQSGIIEIFDIDDLADACRAFLGGILPAGPRVASVGISGGAGILFTDRAIARGLTLAKFGDETNKVLRAAIPSYGSIVNPVDVTASVFNDFALLTDVINAMLADPEVDQLAVMLASLPGEGALRSARAIREAIARHNKPIMLAWVPSRKRAEAAYALLDEGHVPIYESPVRVAEAAVKLAGFSAVRSAAPPAPPPNVKRITLPAGGGPLDEVRSKALLAQIGIPVAREVVLPADCEQPAALDLQYPVAVKILSRDIAHKSEVGGVMLGITGIDGIAAAIRSIRANLKRQRPEAAIDGFIVAEIITDGLETLIGVVRDPSFGPVVAFGLGGIATEALKDVAYRVAPFGIDVARAMIGELRAAALFGAFRGRGALDVEALAEAIARVSVLAAQEERIAELDINPLFVRPRGQGVVAADALIITKP